MSLISQPCFLVLEFIKRFSSQRNILKANSQIIINVAGLSNPEYSKLLNLFQIKQILVNINRTSVALNNLIKKYHNFFWFYLEFKKLLNSGSEILPFWIILSKLFLLFLLVPAILTYFVIGILLPLCHCWLDKECYMMTCNLWQTELA